ncbi:co-chaperone GroES [Algisphaera agarilytica]|uniref:Co-chaperonin GroES n=1 Tax=Algisphaera agarilytica TaxID=1385975 RepID=A0A7X0LJ79_9BACT|nr:co-chaperone GroES [Algisphaera agarilytica]MBB6429030.1 chaperonin GroES [Algisphaera agarilytica]
MKIKPLGDKIIVQRLEAEEKTASGIFLPEGAKEKPQQAKVIRVGTGKTLDNGTVTDFQVKEGDTIILGKWGGTEIKVDGQDYIVMGEDEVLAIVE